MNLRDYLAAARFASQDEPPAPPHLAPCPACSHELSSDARACPHCGHRMPRRPLSRRAKRWIKISVVCALAALYLYARYGATTTTRAIEIQIIR